MVIVSVQGNICFGSLDVKILVILESVIASLNCEAMVKDQNPTYGRSILIEDVAVVKK